MHRYLSYKNTFNLIDYIYLEFAYSAAYVSAIFYVIIALNRLISKSDNDDLHLTQVSFYTIDHSMLD
ncbi:hypothetical protein BLOT_009097 [Blomia tropicalis]|nr:hypothetical protein BLOT_009097 [Blomia tropicalis]